jgi:hypothetical protein
MTRDELFEVAEKVGLGFIRHATDKDIQKFEGLVKLVAFNEREACAKLEIELILSPVFFATMGEYDAHKDAVLAYRNLIRARSGEQK